MIFNIHAILIPLLLAIAWFFIRRPRSFNQCINYGLSLSLLVFLYSMVLYYLTMEDVWDTGWAAYSLWFFLILGVSVLLIVKFYIFLNKKIQSSFYSILILLIAGLIIWVLVEFGKATFIRYSGEKVTVTVVAVPMKCDRYNHIDVSVNYNLQELSISKEECRTERYRVGQKVEVLQHPAFDEVIWPDSNPLAFIGVLIAAIALACYSAWDKYRKVKGVSIPPKDK